jgi:hypothetical protein
MVEAFKFQRDASGERVLLYNKKRSHFHELDGKMAEEVYTSLRLGPSKKCYANAEITKAGKLNISRERLPDQGW